MPWNGVNSTFLGFEQFVWFYIVLYIKMPDWCKFGVENGVGLQGMECVIKEQSSCEPNMTDKWIVDGF